MPTFDCPSCGEKLKMSDELAGKKVRCAKCQAVVVAPADEGITADPKPSARPSGVKSGAPPRMAANDDAGDDEDRGPRRDGSGTAAKAAAGFGIGAIILIVLGVGACLLIPCAGFLLMFPAVGKVRDAAARAQATNDLKQIGLAIHNYNSTFQKLPPPKALKPLQPDGTVEQSWRVSILPFIEQQVVFNQFDPNAAWDAPQNLNASNTPIVTYSDARLNQGKIDNTTFYQYFTGPGTLWPDNGPRTFMQMTDGSSNVIMVSEGKNPVPWAKPADIAVQPGQPPALPPDTVIVAFADGSVRIIDRRRATDAMISAWLDYKSEVPRPSLD